MKYDCTKIYKLSSKNPEIKEIYIGHTSLNINRRYNLHKARSKYAMSKLYTFINEHGSIDEWKIEIIEIFECKSQIEAKQKEKEYIINMKPELNSYIPNRNQKEYRNDNREKYNKYMSNYMRNYKKNLI